MAWKPPSDGIPYTYPMAVADVKIAAADALSIANDLKFAHETFVAVLFQELLLAKQQTEAVDND